jgi:hypothetical protein
MAKIDSAVVSNIGQQQRLIKYWGSKPGLFLEIHPEL